MVGSAPPIKPRAERNAGAAAESARSMPIHIDPNSLYTLLELRDMFDMRLEDLRAAMRSPARRLEAMKFGGEVYVRGEHLLRYLNGQVPDNPTDFSDDAAPEAAPPEPEVKPGQPISGAIMKPGEIDQDAPKVIGGRVKSGTLVKPSTDEQRRLAAPPASPGNSATGAQRRLGGGSSSSGAGFEAGATRRPASPTTQTVPVATPNRPPAPAAAAADDLEAPRRRGPIGAPPPDAMRDAEWSEPPAAVYNPTDQGGVDPDPDSSPITPSRRALNLDVDALVAEAQRLEKERDSGEIPVQGQKRQQPKDKEGGDPSDFSHWL